MTAEKARPGVSEEALAMLREVSTATVTTQLLKLGFRNTFMAGVRPLRPDLRLAGYAMTLRFIPAREDLDLRLDIDNATNPQRIAVETIARDEVLVIDARGEVNGAVLGEILTARIMARGAAGLVTDGALRDSPAIAALGLPAYARAAHANASVIMHHPVEVNAPIGCGGVMVQPGDVIVGDGEGVAVVPLALAEEVARRAHEQEQLESYLLRRVREGAGLRGLYPPNEQTVREYEQWRAQNS